MEKSEPNFYKKVVIPHVRFTVYFLDLSELHGVPMIGSGYTTVFNDTFKEDGRTEVCIFLQDIKKNARNLQYMPYAAHEIMHAIQILCANTGMEVHNELEHTAYIMHYLLEQLIEEETTKQT